MSLIWPGILYGDGFVVAGLPCNVAPPGSTVDQVARQTSTLMTGKDSADLGLGVLFLLGE